MSDIVDRLRDYRGGDVSAWVAMEDAADTITRLTAENEKLKAGLRDCEAELNAYYRMQHPGDHAHSQKELAQAMASNPATVAMKETNNE
jgi:hypothetical protein